jgi:hypothetical protein
MDHWTNFVPYFLMAIKLIALAVAGFFAIKWHFDQDKKLKELAEKDKDLKNS